MTYHSITRVCSWVLVVLAVLLGFGRNAFCQNQPATQPAEVAEFPVVDWGEAITIPVTWDGKQGCFLFDTGCARSILDSTAFAHLKPNGMNASLVTPGGKQKVQMYDPPGLQVGPFSLADSGAVTRVDLADIRAYTGQPVIGILGRSAMSGFVVQIDFDHHVLRVLEADFPTAGWGEHYFMRPDPVRGPVVRLTINGVDQSVLVDTGYSGSIALPTEAFDALAKKSGQRSIGVSALTYAGYVPLRGLRMPVLDFGQLHYHGLIVYETKNGPSVGLDFLERHLATLDFPHNRLYLKPAATFDHVSDSDMSGMHARRYGGHTIAKVIDPGSPADHAGIHAGDEIIELDGKPVADYTLSQIRTLAIAGDGKQMTVTFRHEQSVKTISFRVHRSI